MAEVDRKAYPQDVTDEEWAFVLPYLLLSREDSQSRRHSLRELFNGVRYIVRTGNQWRYMPNDLPPWPAVYQQMRRWMEAGVFEVLLADVQSLLREFGGRKGQPTAVCLDSRTLQSTPESGARAGYDGAKRRKITASGLKRDSLKVSSVFFWISQRTKPPRERAFSPNSFLMMRTPSLICSEPVPSSSLRHPKPHVFHRQESLFRGRVLIGPR